MSKLVWDAVSEHLYETGTDHGVLYPQATSGEYEDGVAWNGITGVDESPEGGENNAKYADNIKYLNLTSAEEWKGTIKAFTYPPEFEPCDGSAQIVEGVHIGQQERKPFGFCYRTLIGNDTEGTDHGYKLHLLYGLKAEPSDKSYETVNDDPDAIEFSWDCASTPVNVPGYKPTSCITIDSTAFKAEAKKALLTALEDKLYGTNGSGGGEGTAPRLPDPAEVFTTLGWVAPQG